MPKKLLVIDQTRARHLWIAAQKLDSAAPFGHGPAATSAAIAHLGYVQIDTINVIERCHHHILFSRIPAYRRSDLTQVQSSDKSVFEYWTHALSYVPTSDLPFFVPAMKQYRETPSRWFGSVTPDEVKKMLKRLRKEGPLSIRDIGDDELVDKDHPWASRKPSKRVLEMMFFQGLVTVGARQGMVKTYDLLARHFGAVPKAATPRQITAYQLDRALRSQGVVSLDSICHLDAPSKKAVKELIDRRVRRKLLVPVTIEGAEKVQHWAAPETLDAPATEPPTLVHILSPFDPLIIQRKRLKLFFDYDHLFEAYLPAAKRKLGYFALPILMGDRIVAAFDLKTDRTGKKLLIQQATWLEDAGAEGRAAVDAALGRFEAFQLGD
ncbi:winged helix-turn-helix domain-containing protein [Devosia ginsengisoli]|uniref:Winged helix-turn-helix domain-containing protein n=1 Tax=Devosia ginsengisoli TaxID=400770 RepID=A0A5B8LY58_9HYPH|nr:winged helix DNA-binding domain-containing protein [Devosia ginsengisoli]QDZ12372.1 winged helix-turn-helix domain-containing protein [Devosia ginsengisoli]